MDYAPLIRAQEEEEKLSRVVEKTQECLQLERLQAAEKELKQQRQVERGQEASLYMTEKNLKVIEAQLEQEKQMQQGGKEYQEQHQSKNSDGFDLPKAKAILEQEIVELKNAREKQGMILKCLEENVQRQKKAYEKSVKQSKSDQLDLLSGPGPSSMASKVFEKMASSAEDETKELGQKGLQTIAMLENSTIRAPMQLLEGLQQLENRDGSDPDDINQLFALVKKATTAPPLENEVNKPLQNQPTATDLINKEHEEEQEQKKKAKVKAKEEREKEERFQERKAKEEERRPERAKTESQREELLEERERKRHERMNPDFWTRLDNVMSTFFAKKNIDGEIGSDIGGLDPEFGSKMMHHVKQIVCERPKHHYVKHYQTSEHDYQCSHEFLLQACEEGLKQVKEEMALDVQKVWEEHKSKFPPEAHEQTLKRLYQRHENEYYRLWTAIAICSSAKVKVSDVPPEVRSNLLKVIDTFINEAFEKGGAKKDSFRKAGLSLPEDFVKLIKEASNPKVSLSLLMVPLLNWNCNVMFLLLTYLGSNKRLSVPLNCEQWGK